MVRFKTVAIQRAKHCAGQCRPCDVRPLANHMTTLQNFTKGEIREFSAFSFSLHLMFDQTLSNLIVCLIIYQRLHTKVIRMS